MHLPRYLSRKFLILHVFLLFFYSVEMRLELSIMFVTTILTARSNDKYDKYIKYIVIKCIHLIYLSLSII